MQSQILLYMGLFFMLGGISFFSVTLQVYMKLSIVSCLTQLTELLQFWLFAYVGAKLTRRLRVLTYRALLRQVSAYTHPIKHM